MAYTPAPVDDPTVATYCRETGPELGGMPRNVLREIGRYANPDTRIAPPNMAVLAETLEVSTATVSRAVNTLVCAGLIEIERIPTPNGRTRNEYTFTTTDWTPAPKPARGKLSLADFRLKRMVDLETMLEGAVNPVTGELIVSQRNNETVESATIEEERKIVTNSENGDYPSSSFGIVPLDESTFNLDSPPATYSRPYVRFAVTQFPTWLKAWKEGLSAAYPFYETRWPKFLEDLDDNYSRDVLRFVATCPSRPTFEDEPAETDDADTVAVILDNELATMRH